MTNTSDRRIKGNSSLPRLCLLIWTTIIVCAHFSSCNAWDNAEMEMYDLVEEVGIGTNFYEVLGISQDATDKEIRQAYRKLSIKIHPDKSDAEDAATKFRQLVGIYEVLKNKELRESYHKVLVEGLPNWRQPMFYFRRARKFALWQVAVIVLSIVSVGQYLAGWASYFEKRLSMKEQVEARLRKTQRTKKGQKEGPTAEELEAEFEKYLPKPSLWDIAPIQLCRGVKYLIFTFPKDILAYREELKLQKEEEEMQAALEAERLEKERLKAEEPKKPRKRKTFKVPEKSEVGNDDDTQPIWNVDESVTVQSQTSAKKQVISGGLWTDDDIAELSKLCSKFPGGTPERWEKISELLCRPVPEVTFMAKKVLEKLSSKTAEEEEEAAPQVKVKVKTKGGKADNIASVDARTVENWSADEQKQLEYALQVYPKGSLERWEKIAHMVPNRSKEECMQRFKYVADMVKKKKEAKPESELESSEQKSEEVPKSDQGGAVEAPQAATSTEKVVVVEESQPEPVNTVSSPTTPAPEPTPAQVVSAPTSVATSTGSSKSKKKSKSKAATNSAPIAAPVVIPVVEEKPQEKPQEKKKGTKSKQAKASSSAADAPATTPSPNATNIASSTVSESVKVETKQVDSTPALVEPEIDSVASQLQSILDEAAINEAASLSSSNVVFDRSPKSPVRRSSSSKSSTEGDVLVVVARGSKESSVERSERKNSTSSNASENEWCVIEESGSEVTISSLNTH